MNKGIQGLKEKLLALIPIQDESQDNQWKLGIWRRINQDFVNLGENRNRIKDKNGFKPRTKINLSPTLNEFTIKDFNFIQQITMLKIKRNF